MYIYFGFTSPGNSVYVISSHKEFGKEHFHRRVEIGYDGNRQSVVTLQIPLNDDGVKVYNAKTRNTWDCSLALKQFMLVHLPDTPYANDVTDYLSKNFYSDELSNIYYPHDIVKKFFTETVCVPNNLSKQHKSNKTFIKGKNLPKIKSTKEFNYVGKIDYIPVSVRNHENVGR